MVSGNFWHLCTRDPSQLVGKFHLTLNTEGLSEYFRAAQFRLIFYSRYSANRQSSGASHVTDLCFNP